MKKHKVYLQELSAEFSEADYSKFYEVVMRRIENGELVPMKSAKNNGGSRHCRYAFGNTKKKRIIRSFMRN